MSIMEIRIGQENQKAVLAPVLFNCVTRKIAFRGQFTYVSGLQFFQRGKEKSKTMYFLGSPEHFTLSQNMSGLTEHKENYK